MSKQRRLILCLTTKRLIEVHANGTRAVVKTSCSGPAAHEYAKELGAYFTMCDGPVKDK